MFSNVRRMVWGGMSNMFGVRSNTEFIFFLMKSVKQKSTGITSNKEMLRNC